MNLFVEATQFHKRAGNYALRKVPRQCRGVDQLDFWASRGCGQSGAHVWGFRVPKKRHRK